MDTASPTAGTSKIGIWAGVVVSLLAASGLLFSAVMKLLQAKDVLDGMPKLGWPADLAVPLGIVELTCTLIYLMPRTAVLGAILLTGYMGGAIATHVRIGEGFVPHIIIGVMLWLGLYLRDARVRALIPLRRPVS